MSYILKCFPPHRPLQVLGKLVPAGKVDQGRTASVAKQKYRYFKPGPSLRSHVLVLQGA